MSDVRPELETFKTCNCFLNTRISSGSVSRSVFWPSAHGVGSLESGKSSMQCARMPCSTHDNARTNLEGSESAWLVRHTATLCNTLQHTAKHCSTLQRTVTPCITMQGKAIWCSEIQGIRARGHTRTWVLAAFCELVCSFRIERSQRERNIIFTTLRGCSKDGMKRLLCFLSTIERHG